MVMIGKSVRLGMHLAAIAVVSGVCGWWLYHQAHAQEFRNFGDFRRSPIGQFNGRFYALGGPDYSRPPRRCPVTDLTAILNTISNDTPMQYGTRPPPGPGQMCVIACKFGQRDFFSVRCDQAGASIVIQTWVQPLRYMPAYETTDCYNIDYGPETASKISAAIDRFNPPQPK